jgi:dihydrofolate synthase/folylpolyglutamate synthase
MKGNVEQLEAMRNEQLYRDLHFVVGMANDKDIDGILSLLPTDATYYFTQASVRRALPASELQHKASQYGLRGEHFPTVSSAYTSALAQARLDDMIFVGGSCFVVGDLLQFLAD